MKIACKGKIYCSSFKRFQFFPFAPSVFSSIVSTLYVVWLIHFVYLQIWATGFLYEYEKIIWCCYDQPNFYSKNYAFSWIFLFLIIFYLDNQIFNIFIPGITFYISLDTFLKILILSSYLLLFSWIFGRRGGYKHCWAFELWC